MMIPLYEDEDPNTPITFRDNNPDGAEFFTDNLELILRALMALEPGDEAVVRNLGVPALQAERIDKTHNGKPLFEFVRTETHIRKASMQSPKRR